MAADIPRLRAPAVMLVLMLVLTSAGCTDAEPTPQTSPRPARSVDAPIPAVSRAAPSPPPETRSQAQSSPAAAPASLPTPEELGPGWRYRFEGADPEDGGGAETPFQERDPDEVVQTTVPMGCARRSPSPVPAEVMQATYAHPGSGSVAVALLMRFDTAESAAGFAAARSQDLATCRDQPDDPYSGAPSPVLDVATPSSRTIVHYRFVGEAQTWTSALAVAGSEVLTVDADPDSPSLVDWASIDLREP